MVSQIVLRNVTLCTTPFLAGFHIEEEGGGGGGKGEKFHRKPKVSPPQRKSGIMLAINNYNIAITAKKIKGQFSPLITAKISSKPF